MKAQREFFAAHPEHGVVVGGECQLWTITRAGLSQRVIHDFGRVRDTAAIEHINMAERLFTADEMAA
jgi:hypothetical protein